MYNSDKAKKCLEILKDFSKNGTVGQKLITEENLAVYRGDTRTMDTITASGGFLPSTKLEEGEDLICHARKQAQEILKRKPVDFIQNWKYLAEDPLILGEKGRLAGVSCGILGGQKGGNVYKITLPELFLAGKNASGLAAIAVYGDSPEIQNCNNLAMHLIRGGEAEEFVFLTKVPAEWIEKCD